MDFEDHLGTENLWLQTTWQQKPIHVVCTAMVVVAIHFLGLKSQINVQYRNQYRNQTNNNPTTPVAKTNCITDLGPASFHSQGEGQESGQLKLTIDKLKAATGTKEFTRLAAWSHYTKHHQPRQTIFTRQYKILSKGGSLKAYIGSVKKLVPSIPIQSQTSRRKRVLVHVHFQSRKKNTDWATVDFRVPFSLSQAHTSGRWRQNRTIGALASHLVLWTDCNHWWKNGTKVTKV